MLKLYQLPLFLWHISSETTNVPTSNLAICGTASRTWSHFVAGYTSQCPLPGWLYCPSRLFDTGMVCPDPDIYPWIVLLTTI